MNDMAKILMQSTTKIMRDICTKELVNDAENGVWAKELWEVLAESGMLTVAVPEEMGGTGGSWADAYQILRLAGKFSAPIPLAETFMGNWLLADLGVDATNVPLAILVNHLEPFQFRKGQEGWIVCGAATAVPWGRNAAKLLVLGESESGSVLGVMSPEAVRINSGRNLAGEPRDTVEVQDAIIPESFVFKVNAGKVHERLLFTGALCRTVMMAGALERILELSVAYSKERTQFGQPIHRFQAVQHHLATLAGEAAAADTAAQSAVDAIEKETAKASISMAKIRLNEAAGIMAPVAHQVHGAIGFTHEHILHQSTRRVLSWREEWGTETEWGEKLAEQLMDLGDNELWSFLTW